MNFNVVFKYDYGGDIMKDGIIIHESDRLEEGYNHVKCIINVLHMKFDFIPKKLCMNGKIYVEIPKLFYKYMYNNNCYVIYYKNNLGIKLIYNTTRKIDLRNAS